MHKEVFMICVFLFSVLVLLGLNAVCILFSGGAPTLMLNGFELPGIIAILAVLLFLSGYGKDFCTLFTSAAKCKALSLEKIRRAEHALDFAIKALFYICFFFVLAATAYYYINLDILQAMGPNLATIICSVFYMVMLDALLVTCKAALRKQAVCVMAEETVSGAVQKADAKTLVLSIVKTLCALLVIAGMTVVIMLSHTINLQKNFTFTVSWLFDIPSLLYLALHCVLLIVISGNGKLLCKSFAAVFTHKTVTESERSLYLNAVSSFRVMLICAGVEATLIGFAAVLTNLENRFYLGRNTYVALLPSFYAAILCLVLLVHQAKVAGLESEA